jgi:hypothetical protein
VRKVVKVAEGTKPTLSTDQRAQGMTQNWYPSEYDRRESIYLARYYVVRKGLTWHVKCGSGTRSLMRFLRKRSAERAAGELLTAFRDGMFVHTSQLHAGGRYA